MILQKKDENLLRHRGEVVLRFTDLLTSVANAYHKIGEIRLPAGDDKLNPVFYQTKRFNSSERLGAIYYWFVQEPKNCLNRFFDFIRGEARFSFIECKQHLRVE